MGVPKLAFKQQGGGSYRFEHFSSAGVSGANSKTEGAINTWNKLNEEAITEASIGSINDINAQIVTLTNLMRKQKAKLNNLIGEDENLATATCEGHHVSCNVPSKLSSYSSAEIEVLKGEIELLDNMITFLGFLKTYLGFVKENNMYYRIEV